MNKIILLAFGILCLGCKNDAELTMERGIQYYEWNLIDKSIIEFKKVIHMFPENTKKLTYEKTGDITSILFLSNTLFLTTENGYFIFLDYKNGEIKNYLKVSKSFLTRPIVVDGNIIIIDSNTRILKFD